MRKKLTLLMNNVKLSLLKICNQLTVFFDVFFLAMGQGKECNIAQKNNF